MLILKKFSILRWFYLPNFGVCLPLLHRLQIRRWRPARLASVKQFKLRSY